MNYIVVRQYVNGDGTITTIVPETVHERKEYAIVEAGNLAGKMFLNLKDVEFVRKSDEFRIVDKGGAVVFKVYPIRRKA